MARYNEHNEQIPEQTPVELPVGYSTPETLQQTISRMIKTNDFNKIVQDSGHETEEEANDFEVDHDEPHMMSPYEYLDMAEEHLELQPVGPPEEKPVETTQVDEPPKTPVE